MNMPEINSFANYLYTQWSGTELSHSYSVPNTRMWKNAISCQVWSCTGLRSARDRFVWNRGTDDFDNFSEDIITAIKNKNESSARDLCFEILQWGGVGKSETDPSRVWINTNYKAGLLTRRLSNAVQALSSQEENIDDFDGIILPMNSGMTKIYSACDPNKRVLIYDGRVGAALCLLIRYFLKSRNFQHIPEELLFRWGRSRDVYVTGSRNKRDPSDSQFRFPQLFTSNRKDWHHASCSRRFNLLAKLFCSAAVTNGEEVTGADLERSLFMVGYDVRGRPQK